MTTAKANLSEMILLLRFRFKCLEWIESGFEMDDNGIVRCGEMSPHDKEKV